MKLIHGPSGTDIRQWLNEYRQLGFAVAQHKQHLIPALIVLIFLDQDQWKLLVFI